MKEDAEKSSERVENLMKRDEAEPSERAQKKLKTDGEEQCIKVTLPDGTTFYSLQQLQNEASGESLKAEKRQAIKPKGEKKLKNKNKKKRAISEVCLVEEELNKVQEAQSAPSYLQDGVKAVEEKLEQINLFLFQLFGEEEKPIFLSASLGITEKESIVNFLKGIQRCVCLDLR